MKSKAGVCLILFAIWFMTSVHVLAAEAIILRSSVTPEEAWVGQKVVLPELSPEWEDATINREIALARAAMLKREGGDMTGGMLEADEIVFSKGKSPPSAGEEQIEDGGQISDAEQRAVWLRHVQTKPADFLQAKFAYQYAMRPLQDSAHEVTQ